MILDFIPYVPRPDPADYTWPYDAEEYEKAVIAWLTQTP